MINKEDINSIRSPGDEITAGDLSVKVAIADTIVHKDSLTTDLHRAK